MLGLICPYQGRLVIGEKSVCLGNRFLPSLEEGCELAYRQPRKRDPERSRLEKDFRVVDGLGSGEPEQNKMAV